MTSTFLDYVDEVVKCLRLPIVFFILLLGFFFLSSQQMLVALINYYGLMDDVVVLSPLETLSVEFNLSLALALLFTLPMLPTQIMRFLTGTVYYQSARMLMRLFTISYTLLLVGFLFGFLPLSKMMLEALVSMAFVQPVWSLTSIVNLILMQAILIGLCMQVILLIPLLCYVGVLSPNFLDKRRKIVFMVTLIITSFITPTGDALSEVIILCPTYLALELGILIAKTGMIKHVWK